MAETYARRDPPEKYQRSWFAEELAKIQRVLAGLGGGSSALGSSSTARTANLLIAGTATTVLSLSLAAGTWLVTATFALSDLAVSGGIIAQLRLTDGTTTYATGTWDQGSDTGNVAGGATTITLAAPITLAAAGTVTMQGLSTGNSFTALGSATTTNPRCTMSAVQLR